MRIRDNLSSIVSSTSRGIVVPNTRNQIGKVFGVITTENTPTEELFKRSGGFNNIGTIFYLEYEQSKNLSEVDLTTCKTAKPFNSSTQDYPLIGELVLLTDGPSAATQINSNSSQKYYLGVVNLWNNNQHNSPSPNSLGTNFIENTDIRKVISFEGDRIYQGRKGNGIRFGSTVKKQSSISEWSRGNNNDGDPITILVNGYVTTDKNSLSPNIEEINKEMSSIYMTSTQKIPLTPDRINTLNPITQPKLPGVYEGGSQMLLNSDRITINSKRDEVMIFAKTNIEINTNNIINLNAGNYTHINSPNISLGTKSDGSLADEPLLLGGKTVELLTQLMSILSELGNGLSSVISTSQGSPLVGVNTIGVNIVGKIEDLQKKLKNITSNNNFTT